NRREDNDKNGVDPGQLADGRVQSHFAIAELWKDVIHLQENRFQESDEEKEQQQPVKPGLPDQPPKEIERCRRAGANRRQNRRMRLSFAFFAASQKINRRKEQDLERETHTEELFMRRRLKSCDAHMKIERAKEIENITGDEVADVHERVDDRERHRTLRRCRIDARRREQHWRA